MNTVQRIAKNTGVMFLSQILTYVLGFFITMYTGQYLGANGFGIISLALSITAIFGVFVDMGLSTLMIRETARNKSLSNKYIVNLALMKVPLSILTFGSIALLVYCFHYSPMVANVIYIITLSVILNSFSGILAAIFQSHEKMEYLSVNNILNSILIFAGVLIGIRYNFSVTFFALVYVIANALSLIYVGSVYIWKFSMPKFEIDLSFWKPTIKEAWSFGLIGLSGNLYTYIDSIMLSVFQGTEVVGLYSAAYRLMLVTLFIPTTINTAVFPVMSRFYNSSRESLNLMYERYFKYMIIVGIPMGVGTTILAKSIILLIFKSGYIESVGALQILIWTMVFTFIGASFVQLLQSINKQLIITKISIICVIINILLNLVLIPRYSFIGASIATLLTEVILVSYIISTSYKLGYKIEHKIVLKDLARVIVASTVMSIFLLHFHYLNLFLLIVLGILVYFAVLYSVGGIDDVDRDLIKQTLKR